MTSAPVERSPERDAAIAAMVPFVGTQGWTTRALRDGLMAATGAAEGAAFLFNGPLDMIEAYLDFADRRMEAVAAELTETSLTKRVRAAIALRLRQAAAERPAARRATAILALPTNAALAARTLGRTVDSIWHAAGDVSADVSWYTKRAILAGVYGATVLYWLRHDEWSDPDDADTLAFLDRRLAMIGGIGKARARASAALRGLLPPRLRPAA